MPALPNQQVPTAAGRPSLSAARKTGVKAQEEEGRTEVKESNGCQAQTHPRGLEEESDLIRVVAADSARAGATAASSRSWGRLQNPQTDPSTIELDEAKVKDWLGQGPRQPTEAVAKLIKILRHRETTSATSLQ